MRKISIERASRQAPRVIFTEYWDEGCTSTYDVQGLIHYRRFRKVSIATIAFSKLWTSRHKILLENDAIYTLENRDESYIHSPA